MSVTPAQLFDKHRATLDAAVQAIQTRGYWTPYPEMPSPKVYGETALEDGRQAVEACFNRQFELGQPGQTAWMATERSPYGVELNVR